MSRDTSKKQDLSAFGPGQSTPILSSLLGAGTSAGTWMWMRCLWGIAALTCAVFLSPSTALGQAGVLLVEGQRAPDPSVLAMVELRVRIRLDHLHATVSVEQVFENRTSRQLQGRYELALGRGAAVSAFALWEGAHRRAATVVERERGRRIFEEITARNLDPGLLETADQGPRQNIYTVRVDPIQPYSRVRIEVGYSQEVELAADEGVFTFPLAGREYTEQSVGHLLVDLEVEGAWPLEGVELRPEGFELIRPPGEGGTGLQARLEARDQTLTQDLTVALRLDRDPRHPLRPALLAYRRPITGEGLVDRTAFGGGRVYTDDRGYFVVRSPAQFDRPDEGEAPPQDVVIALDTSLSMRGGKLERAVGAVEGLLERLGPRDRFGLLTFHDRVVLFGEGDERLAPPTEERRDAARRFFRSGYLSGGTDLRAVLPAALALLRGSEAAQRTVVVITDGQPSLGELESTAIAEAVAGANQGLGDSRARLFILGVGDDANHLLLERLARESEGLYAHVGEGADLAPVLRGFLYRLRAPLLSEVRLDTSGVTGLEDLYPAGPVPVFDGSDLVVFGRDRDPLPRARLRVLGRRNGRVLEAVLTGALPREDTERSWIARGWAQRRIGDLLARIDAEGERPEWVSEIIALAREHMLVTPYTSLIAAARSLLRPREIQPGDPVLRVRTDPSDRTVTALFPFGLTKELRRLDEGVFETRFLAPRHLAEGRHDVELIVTGPDGRRRRVRDHFVIDSRAPEPRIEPIEEPARAGERLRLRVRSDRDTRRLMVYLNGRGPLAELRWSDRELACVGELPLDRDLPTGSYPLVVVAEDFAHNIGSTSTVLEVRGR